MARKSAKKAISGKTGPPVWALAVVSSEAQSETLPHQRRWAEETAAAKGWRLTRVIEGVATGKAGPRKTVRDLLIDLRSIEPEARPKRLLMIRADRLGRGSIIDSQIILRDLRELGVAVYTRDQGEVKLDSTMDQLISAATLAVAAHENDVRSDKMKQVRRRKREAGEPMGACPYGLLSVNKRYAPDPERAAIVREAFRLRLQGNGYDAIGKRLTAIALPHVFLNGKSRVVHWTTTRVRNLLTTRAYIGPIVDEAMFARAQRVAAVLTNPSRNGDRRRRYPWPLAGCLKCFCGRVLIGMVCGQEPWRYRYYTCKARWNHDGRLTMHRAEKLEEQFVDVLRRLRVSPELAERFSRRAASPVAPKILERSAREITAKLAENARRRDAAWELHVNGKVRAEDVQERLDKLTDERENLQGQIASVEEQLAIGRMTAKRIVDLEGLFRRAPTVFMKADVERQNEMARAVALTIGGFYVEQGTLKFEVQRNHSGRSRAS